MLEQAKMSVGQVAERSGVAVSTLHFYESKGLISSLRNAGNQRRYRQEILRRIAIIKTAQKLGVSLEQIKAAFETLPQNRTPTQSDWETLSSHWQADLNKRIALLQKLSDRLTGCIGCGCLSMQHCPLYNEDDHLAEQGSGPRLLDTSDASSNSSKP